MVSNIMVQRGDIWYANLGEGIGSEQTGIRPVIIIQNDVGNRHSPTIIIAPTTSQQGKAKLPTHVEILSDENTGLEVRSTILLEQVKVMDKRRLLEKIGSCSQMTINNIDKALMISLGIQVNKTSVVNDVNSYRNNRVGEERFDKDRALDLGISINKLEKYINKHYGDDENIMDIEDTIKTLLYELRKYCNLFKNNVDYRFFYKPIVREKRNHLMAEKLG